MPQHPDFFIESKPYPKQHIQRLFVDSTEYERDLIDKRLIEQADEMWSFSFVGLIQVQSRKIFVLPKYYELLEELPPQSTLLNEALEIFRILRKAARSYKALPDLEDSVLTSKTFSEIVIADFLLQDYISHGLYQKSEEDLTDADDNIDWNKTIESLSPTFSAAQPIYFDTLSTRRVTNEAHLITEIHKWAVADALKSYGSWLGYTISSGFDAASEVAELGETNYLTHIVEVEMNGLYDDRNIKLLLVLLRLLKDPNNATGQPRISIFGTRYFHIVWEQVCSFVFRNEYQKFQYLFPRPIYYDAEGRGIPVGTLRPDIVFEIKDQECLYILDAKYYNFCFDYSHKTTVKSSPGVPDIVKQFAYELSLDIQQFRSICNLFLFPKLQLDPISFEGRIEFEAFSGRTITLANLSVRDAFGAYLNGKAVGREFLTGGVFKNNSNARCGTLNSIQAQANGAMPNV